MDIIPRLALRTSPFWGKCWRSFFLCATPSPSLIRSAGVSLEVGEHRCWEGLRGPIRSFLFFLTEFECEMFGEKVQLGFTIVSPGLWVFPGCRKFGAKTKKVLGKLCSVRHPKYRHYGGWKLRPTNRDISKQKPWSKWGETGSRQSKKQAGRQQRNEAQAQTPAGFPELLSSSCPLSVLLLYPKCQRAMSNCSEGLGNHFLFFTLPHINNNPAHR